MEVSTLFIARRLEAVMNPKSYSRKPKLRCDWLKESVRPRDRLLHIEFPFPMMFGVGISPIAIKLKRCYYLR